MIMPKRIFISGASSGLGKSLALQYAGSGVKLVLLARSQSSLEVVKKEVEKKGAQAFLIACDLGDLDLLKEKTKEGLAWLGEAPDLFIHSAAHGPMGTMGRSDSSTDDSPLLKSLLESKIEELEQVLRINSLSALVLAQEIFPSMIEKKKGTAIFIGATASFRVKPNYGLFAISKYALRAITEGLYEETRKEGVHVVHLVLDGVLNIPRMREILPDASPEALLDPEEIGKTILFLHSQPSTTWVSELWLKPSRDISES